MGGTTLHRRDFFATAERRGTLSLRPKSDDFVYDH
jgi:hypothetical protein